MSKILVITGASRGIGNALVQHASAYGHQVYALSRNISSIKKDSSSTSYRDRYFGRKYPFSFSRPTSKRGSED